MAGTGHLVPVSGPSESFDELRPGEVEGGVLVTGHRLGADHRTLRHDGELDPLTRLRLPRVLVVSDVDLDTLRPRCELLDLGDLVFDVRAKAVGDGQLASGDNNVHDGSLATRSSEESDPIPLDG